MPVNAPVNSQRYEPDADLAALCDHPRNPRRGDDASVAASIDRNGWYGAIVAHEATGQILAGHTRRRALTAAGVTRGPVLWVDCDDETALRILLADNQTAALASWDDEELAALLGDVGDLTGTGFGEADLERIIDELNGTSAPAETTPEEKYERATDAPHYEPTGEQPPIAELYDDSRTAKRLEAIAAVADLPEELRRFLELAAHRHTAFRYDKIADYYADAEPHVQRLMEDSVLVIVDMDDAIRLGYVKLSQTLDNLRELDAQDAQDADEDDES